MIRISFRQGMLAGFVIIVLLLGGAALRSWLVVEHFAEQSRRNGEQALQLAASIQELGERTVDMERSARQFLVLQRCLLSQAENNFVKNIPGNRDVFSFSLLFP